MGSEESLPLPPICLFKTKPTPGERGGSWDWREVKRTKRKGAGFGLAEGACVGLLLPSLAL